MAKIYGFNNGENLDNLDDKEYMDAFFRGIVYILALFGFLLILSLFCTSCTTTRYVPVEHVRTDTLIISKVQRDSIWMKDSTHVSEKQRGDTVWLEVERWHTKYKEKLVYDTLYQSHVDSVPVPYPVPEYVEKQLSWWQKTRLGIANFAIGLAVLWIVWFCIKKRLAILTVFRAILSRW